MGDVRQRSSEWERREAYDAERTGWPDVACLYGTFVALAEYICGKRPGCHSFQNRLGKITSVRKRCERSHDDKIRSSKEASRPESR
jgi:hypothetical protein